MNNLSQTISQIPVDRILPNPNQPRRNFDVQKLKELADSIKTYGQISPIQVRKLSDNLYELVAGERRLRACKQCGLKKIDAIVTEMNDKDSAIISIMENIQREDLTYFEEAKSYVQLMKYYKMTQEQIAKALGKSQSFVANKIRLLKLPESVIEKITNLQLSERHARALLRIPDEKIQLETIEKIVKRNLNVKKTEELVEFIRDRVLTNNYDEPITPDKKARVKSFINARIYVNTIKSAFKQVSETKKNAEYKEFDKDDYVEIRIKIPK